MLSRRLGGVTDPQAADPGRTEQAARDKPTVVLIHGAATTSRVWRKVTPLLPEWDVRVPDRAASGSMEQELADLTAVSAGAFVVGVSGGATLGLALVAAGVPVRGALLHEPAAGSLAPGLLDAVAAAWAAGGVPAFATTLYGPAWSPAEAPADTEAVGRELAMFRGFEPVLLPTGHPPVLLTVGELSPPARHAAVAALAGFLGVPAATVPGGRHAVHLEHPEAFAALIRGLLPLAGGEM
jgi:pimeloyl-ACP methyl ester carboxylesterase